MFETLVADGATGAWDEALEGRGKVGETCGDPVAAAVEEPGVFWKESRRSLRRVILPPPPPGRFLSF